MKRPADPRTLNRLNAVLLRGLFFVALAARCLEPSVILAQTLSPATTAAWADAQAFAFHVQATDVTQFQPAFTSPYHGAQSLQADANGRSTNDLTVFAGARLWPGAELWLDPELDQGFGLSNSVGVAGFPNGEAYKVGKSTPYLKLPRLFLRQTLNLGGATENQDADLNALASRHTANRLVLTLGKFSVADVFDTNPYAHDPRGDFLNWSLIDTGTFDYAADAWGFTYGAAGEWYQGPWTLRAGLFALSSQPNSPSLDASFSQFQADGELERRFDLAGKTGAIRLTGFLSRGRMGDLRQALDRAQRDGGVPALSDVRHYAGRGGVSLDGDVQLSPQVGVFVRAGVADGRKEVYEFTDIDNTAAAGISLNGQGWGRADDAVGLAAVVNQISRLRRTYLSEGGLGLLIGDGRLTHAGPETIAETNYNWAVNRAVRLTFDYQLIGDPAFNADRGPVSVLSARLHAQY